jgi:hypothetical protein
MNFITTSFFEFEPLQIANVTENGSVQIEVNRFIGQYEKQCLIDVLGPELAKELNDSYEIVNNAFVLKSDATQAIKDLVNGKVYDTPEDADEIISWNLLWYGCGCDGEASPKRTYPGIVITENYFVGTNLTEFKTSFIADYIHYHYLLTHRSTTTGAGQQVLEGENSQTVSNFSKRIDSWNSFCFKAANLYRFLHDHKENYPTWKANCNIRFKEKY